MFPWSATVKWPARHPSPPQTQTMQLAYSTCSLSVALATFFSFLFLFLPLHLALLSSSHYGFSCSSPTSCAYTLYIVLFCFFFSTFYLLTLRSLSNVSCPLSFVAPISLYSLVFCYFDVACVRNSRISPECITRIVDNQKKSEKSRLIRFTCVILFERFISVKFNHFNFLQNWWYPLRFSNMR